MDMTYRFTPATVTAAADDAKSAATQLKLLRHTLPVGLLVGGGVLVMIGLLLLTWVRGRKSDDDGDAALAELLLASEDRVPTHFS